MKVYRIKFPEPLTEKQEECLYAGFSAFYYTVEDGFTQGINKANGRLYQMLSRLASRVTNLNGANQAIQRLMAIRETLNAYINWNRIEPGLYEFQLAVEYFNAFSDFGTYKGNMGNKLDKKFIKLFTEQILKKLNIKKEDVTISVVI
jgi:hypothetical protein